MSNAKLFVVIHTKKKLMPVSGSDSQAGRTNAVEAGGEKAARAG